MKKLWAPWRMKYIGTLKDEGCIFCEKPKEGRDEENLILYRGDLAFVIMNKFPYNNGHVMIAPYRHIRTLEELDEDEMLECLRLTKVMERCIRKVMSPDGFNFGSNIGRDAGAGFEHLHFHLVPRWRGDTNYMPILGEVKVLPEYLKVTYRKLHGCLKEE